MSKVTPVVEYIVAEGAWRYMGSNGRFIISPSTDSYTLNYSADGATWEAWGEATPANDPLMVQEAVTGMFFKLVGNTKKVAVTY